MEVSKFRKSETTQDKIQFGGFVVTAQQPLSLSPSLLPAHSLVYTCSVRERRYLGQCRGCPSTGAQSSMDSMRLPLLNLLTSRKTSTIASSTCGLDLAVGNGEEVKSDATQTPQNGKVFYR